MVGIFTDHQHKRLHDRLSMVDSINLQFPFGALMTGDAVQQHHFIQLLVPKVVKINVGACDSKGCMSIAVLDGLGHESALNVPPVDEIILKISVSPGDHRLSDKSGDLHDSV